MKKLFISFAAIISLLCFSCTKNAAHPTLDRIKEKGVLLVGTTGDYRPLTFREEDGTYWGFGIEVARVISEKLGVEIKFVPTSWPTLTEDTLATPQKFHFAIGGITITEARKKNMDMSEGYLSNGKTILCRKEEVSRFRSLSDIDKKEVVVMVNPGGLNEKFARANLKNAAIVVFEKNELIPEQIALGNADIMITEITEAPWYIQNDGRLAAPLMASPFTHGEIGVLLQKGQDDLLLFINDTIAQMKKDGTLGRLKEKYGLN